MPTESPILSTGASTPNPEASPAAPPPPESPERALAELAKPELDHWAEEFGLDPTRYSTRTDLAAAVDERRKQIAAWDRAAMLELLAWGRRPAPPTNADKEEIARQIALIRSMKFSGLSREALRILAAMRQAQVKETDGIPDLIRKLKRQEGFVEKWNRKKRAFLGKMISNLVGENDSLPAAPSTPDDPVQAPPRQQNIREEIEEAGLLSGITNRIKRTADQYLNQKLDEVEARIDRKLEEIDRRLGEWRDKEIANRLRILKITLWASVIVGVVSLIYSWLKLYLTAGG